MTKTAPRIIARSVIGLLLLIAAGCSSEDPASPSAAQAPEVPHPFDQSPGDSVWIPNPDVATDREYWVIFRQSDGSHYMFPRPDGEPLIAAACDEATRTDLDDETAGFVALAQELRLCTGASSSAAVQRINALTLAEANQLSTWLHARLWFAPTESGVWPFALTSDRVRICRTLADDGQLAAGEPFEGLANLCEWDLGRANGGAQTDIARLMSADEAELMADQLNKLYGTTPPE